MARRERILFIVFFFCLKVFSFDYFQLTYCFAEKCNQRCSETKKNQTCTELKNLEYSPPNYVESLFDLEEISTVHFTSTLVLDENSAPAAKLLSCDEPNDFSPKKSTDYYSR